MRTIKLIILIGVISFWSVAWLLSENLFSEGYLQIGHAIFVGLFFIFGLLAFIVLLKFRYFAQKGLTPFLSKKNNSQTKKYIWTVIVTILFFPLLFWGIDGAFHPTKIEANDLVEVRGTLKEIPKYTTGPKAGSGSVVFKILEFPNIKFDLPYPNYLHYQTSLENDFSTADSVFYSVSKEDYQAYIKTDKEFSFSQKYNTHNVIQVMTIRSAVTSYLTLSQHNQLNIKESKYAILFVILIILFGLYIFQFIWKKEICNYLDNRGFQKMKTIIEKINKKT